VLKAGEKVKSGQSGFEISLPAQKVGQIRIVSRFGDNETNEGALADIISGDITDTQKSALYISEKE
jgi:hypothetical protein